jgi:hypothetical protein
MRGEGKVSRKRKWTDRRALQTVGWGMLGEGLCCRTRSRFSLSMAQGKDIPEKSARQ